MQRAIIFDLDGTLLDTLEDLASSVNDALSLRGHPTHPESAYRRFVGDGIVRLAARSLPPDRAGDSVEVEALVAAMAEIYAERCAHSTAPYPGIMELLERLERLDVRMAVLSNKPHEMTRRLLATFFAQVRFERVEGARAGVARKPDPRMALEIAASLEAAPERVVYVGDTDTDMRTANAAGMHAVGALWGFREAEELRAAGARTLVSRPSELLELFD